MDFSEKTDIVYEARICKFLHVRVNDSIEKIMATVEIIRVMPSTVELVKLLDVKIHINRVNEGFPVLLNLGYIAYLKGVVIQNLIKDVKHGELDIGHLMFKESADICFGHDVESISCDREFTCPFNLAWMATVAQRVEDALDDLPKYYNGSGRDFFEKN